MQCVICVCAFMVAVGLLVANSGGKQKGHRVSLPQSLACYCRRYPRAHSWPINDSIILKFEQLYSYTIESLSNHVLEKGELELI